MPLDKQDCYLILRAVFNEFLTFDDLEWNAFVHLTTLHHWSSRDFIFKTGDVVSSVHFVVDGIGRTFFTTHEGKEKNRSIDRVGDAFVSMNTLVQGLPSPFCSQAITPCITVSIDYKDINTLGADIPRWNHCFRLLLELCLMEKERREASFLTQPAAERYQQFLEEFSQDLDCIPLYHVASYLGITDVALSRIRKELGFIVKKTYL